VIYTNWDKISPVLEAVGKRFQEALGPKIQAIIEKVKAILTELWNGPLGSLVRGAMSLLGEFAAIFSRVFGEVVVRVLGAAMEFVSGALGIALDLLRGIGQFLTGDFSGAWESMKSVVVGVFHTVVGMAESLLPGVTEAVRKMYNGVKTWLMDKLGAVFNWVGDKVQGVTNFFKDMYVAVVGNSYVPDMVDEIGQHMARLQTLMVDPARKATQSVTEAARQMASDVSALLDRLFPEIAEMRSQMADLALLEKSGLTGAALTQARLRVLGAGGDAPISEGLLNTGPLTDTIKDFDKVLDAMGDKAKVQTVRVAQTFKDMADSVVSSLQRLVGSLKGGSFLDILGAVIGLGTQLGQLGVFGKSIQTNLNKPIPGYANGTNYAPGGLSLVGERGPELVNLPRGAGVMSNRELRSLGGTSVQVIPSPYFDVVVDGRIVQASPAVANAGAMQAQAMAGRSARRRVR
jgi:phage-related protein